MTKSSGTRRRRQTKQSSGASQNSKTKDNGEIPVTKIRSRLKNSLYSWKGLLVCAGMILLILGSMHLSDDNTTQQDQQDPETSRESYKTEEKKETDAAIPTYRGHYELLGTLPHDPKAFTQGLTFANGNLYEGTGLHGQSELRRVDPQTGNVLKSSVLQREFFGEGIAYYTNSKGVGLIIQLTWREQTGFIYNADTFDVVRRFQYNTTTNEGWGITYNDNEKEFIVSDGSDWLHFWDRDTLQEKRRVQVVFLQNTADGAGTELVRQPVKYLNELEMDERGSILANIWYQDVLVRIDPNMGNVQRIYYFSNLYTDRIAEADCFNGISLTDQKDVFYVTGKNWPHMYRIMLS